MNEINDTYSLPLIGEPFPHVEVNTTLGKITLPDDYKGEWFILFSHPGDFTPVCTTEFVEFESKRKKFKQLNTELIGLSVDRVYSHLKWIEWIRDNLKVTIKFPIIEDSLGLLSNQLGMIHPDEGPQTVRAVYIVDNNGIIRLILYYPQEIGRNIDEIYRAVDALQISDEYKVATPANWPNNQIIGSNVIVPPASNVQEISERIDMSKQDEIQCFDWWFCFKKFK